MNKKNLLSVIIAAFIGISLFSCGGSGNKKIEAAVVSDSISPEIAALNAKIKADPNNPDLYNQRASLLVTLKKTDEALADIRMALNIDSSKAVYFLTLSDIYFAMGKVKKCQQSLEKSMSLEPENDSADLKYAELNLYFRDYKKTLEYIGKALETDKINARAYFMKGITHKEMGDTAKAVASFQTAVDQDPEYYHAYIQLGVLYATRNNPLAADYYKNALKQNPNSIEARYGLGMYYQENEEYNKAISEYDSILRIEPKYKQAHYNLGYIHLVYLKVYSQAVKHFTMAIDCDAKYAEAYYNRGYSYELMGDIMNAKTDYTRAIDIRPNYERAIAGLNRIETAPKK